MSIQDRINALPPAKRAAVERIMRQMSKINLTEAAFEAGFAYGRDPTWTQGWKEAYDHYTSDEAFMESEDE